MKAAKNSMVQEPDASTIKLMDDDEVTLNKVVVELVPMDPDFADQNVKEELLELESEEKLENGFSGRKKAKMDMKELVLNMMMVLITG